MNFSNYLPPKVIAEIGCNHKGDLNIARELIRLAKECNADYAKFQKRNPRELLSEAQFNEKHPVAYQSYGNSYGQHREALEFTINQHQELKNYAESIGINYACSVWDITSAKEIITLRPDFIKVPSATNCNFQMLEILRDAYDGDVHLSLGMTTQDEIEKIIRFFEQTDQAKTRLILYSCTTGYPISFHEVCLLEISKLAQRYQQRVKQIGFSGHHLGIAVDVAAYTLGAVWIERHFTKDRSWKGTDHAASLEVPGLKKLVRDLHHTHEALIFKNPEILEIEEIQRKKLKHSVH